MIKILIADDHKIFLEGLKQIISKHSDMVVAGEASNANEVLDQCNKNDFDVVVLDISMPGRSGLDILRQLINENPKLQVLFLSMHPEEQFAIRALKTGGAGYLTKDSAPDELINAIRKVSAGGKYVTLTFAEKLAINLDDYIEKPLHESLTNREYQIMRMISIGKTGREIAEELNKIFLEVICAPGYTDGALSLLKKKKNRRLVKQLKSVTEKSASFRNIPGGIIKQDSDRVDLIDDNLEVVTEKKPSAEELKDLKFAWKIAKNTKSNAIVFARNKAALGVGAGQMSRLDSVKIAKMKAEEHGLDLKGSVAASDAFFPFADGLVEIIKCGAASVIQPGGSVRDQEVIDAANENNISMVFTGIRHFKH